MAGTVKSVNNPTASVQATGDLQGSIVDITVSGFDGGALTFWCGARDITNKLRWSALNVQSASRSGGLQPPSG